MTVFSKELLYFLIVAWVILFRYDNQKYVQSQLSLEWVSQVFGGAAVVMSLFSALVAVRGYKKIT